MKRTIPLLTMGAVAALILTSVPASAQDGDRCYFFCRPEVKFEPTFTVENLFNRHRIAEMDGDVQTGTALAERETVFEAIVAVGIPTSVPRVGFTFETIFIPFAETSDNPFTGATSGSLGRPIRDNSPEVELELNLEWLRTEDTGGWVGSHFDIVDKISPSERPADASLYTHKLNLEWDTGVHVFNWLPDTNWLHHFEVEGSLDYVPRGLPRAGDRIGNELYLDDASRWSFSLVFVLPLAPLIP
jgi:hypothetical protein